ncbi:DUF2569 domain-containing protein [Paenibacillus radicis (ex Xue et al. 2023)]|uniref:DUF2569 domain-containing protein n=1 Tax=Paenibacillus radicis (ex Xue et al. 2023) TaxID=2972489 RepID=A0ABT1YQ78_9BACL|nr:DUF2569 domain-containing protein [Paenibacillus radicis (ex Xue et al. 2023)]MCR8635333.1 DUF2569 domain-containing protein [Paenibacillus radicis (ex Xue et al. 2023)]
MDNNEIDHLKQESEMDGIKGWLLIYLVVNLGVELLGKVYILYEWIQYYIFGFDFFVGIFHFAFLIMTMLLLIFTRKKVVPKVVIAYESLVILSQIQDYLDGTTVKLSSIMITVTISVLWILYFIKSKRVSNTYNRA